MKNLKFRFAAARNFLPFGPDGIEIYFDDYGQVVLVKGTNLDTGTDRNPASNGVGKCFGINTPVLMFDGTTKMVQDVANNDLVMGPDSLSRRVVGVTSGREPLYKVIPKKGDFYIVNESHILTLKSGDKKDRQFRNHSSRVANRYDISVRDYLGQTRTFKNVTKGYRAGVEFIYKQVKIDPYCLGLWLGDGSTSGPAITNQDEEVVSAWFALGEQYNLCTVPNHSKKCPTYLLSASRRNAPGVDAIWAYRLRVHDGLKYKEIVQAVNEEFIRNPIDIITVKKWVKTVKDWVADGNKAEAPDLINATPVDYHDWENQNPLLNDLKHYNLIGNKHVPIDYKANSRKVRLQVLAGLLDTDGSLSNDCYDFINKSRQLAEDVAFLARSLGLAAYLKPCRKTCQTGKTLVYYRVTISGDCSTIPVRIRRKICPARKINKDALMVGINIEPLEEGDYYGFQVSGDGLFLLGDFTVVHNSSIQDIISYALYGQTVKRPKKIGHDDVVNKTTGQDMMVEVQFDEYRIVRTRKSGTNKVELWKSPNHLWDKETKISKGKGIQDQIDETIGLSHTAFCNVVVFDDSNAYSFLELDSDGKRNVVENLLGLDRFRRYHDAAKKKVKDQKSLIKDLSRDYEHLTDSAKDAGLRIAQVQKQEANWRGTEESKLLVLKSRLKGMVLELQSCDSGKALVEHQAAQEQAEVISLTVVQAQAKKEKIIALIQEAEIRQASMGDGLEVLQDTRQKHLGELNRLSASVLEAKRKLAEMDHLHEGTKCPTCHGTISKANYGAVFQHEQNIAQAAVVQKEDEEVHLHLAEEKITARKTNIAKMREHLAEAKKRLSALDQRIFADTREMNRLLALPKPEVGERERALEADIVSFKKHIGEKQVEIGRDSPYREILDGALNDKAARTTESEVKGKELEEAEDRLKYYEFWVEAFGDKGIRKQVVDGIIPALNSRVAYWLQFLIDSKIQLTFDSQLTETISRNGVEAYYHTMSNGEKRRINLAVSQAFAYVMMLNSGHCPSIVFLDEITGGGIDQNGVTGIYNMIFELAKERQVFVTTHNQALLQMLQGCESLDLVKKGDVTTLIA